MLHLSAVAQWAGGNKQLNHSFTHSFIQKVMGNTKYCWCSRNAVLKTVLGFTIQLQKQTVSKFKTTNCDRCNERGMTERQERGGRLNRVRSHPATQIQMQTWSSDPVDNRASVMGWMGQRGSSQTPCRHSPNLGPLGQPTGKSNNVTPGWRCSTLPSALSLSPSSRYSGTPSGRPGTERDSERWKFPTLFSADSVPQQGLE